MIRTRWLAAAMFAAFVSACGATGGQGGIEAPGATARSVLTREQIMNVSTGNVYDAIVALRPQWLEPRGMDSFSNPGQVQAYVDNNRLFGVEALRNVAVLDVVAVEYYDANQATARWGLDHGHGAINVRTR